MQNNENLIIKMKNGDTSAMDRFLSMHYPEIYRFVYRTCHGDEQSKDITQEVFIRFLSHLETYEDRKPVKHYLLRIAMNLCRDYFRKCKAHPNEELQDERWADPQKQPHIQIREQSEQEIIQACLASLSDDQRIAIILRYYHELKFKEIAILMDTSESTIKSRVSLGLKKVKKQMEEEYQWSHS